MVAGETRGIEALGGGRGGGRISEGRVGGFWADPGQYGRRSAGLGHLRRGCIKRPRGGQGKEPDPRVLGFGARTVLLEKH